MAFYYYYTVRNGDVKLEEYFFRREFRGGFLAGIGAWGSVRQLLWTE